MSGSAQKSQHAVWRSRDMPLDAHGVYNKGARTALVIIVVRTGRAA